MNRICIHYRPSLWNPLENQLNSRSSSAFALPMRHPIRMSLSQALEESTIQSLHALPNPQITVLARELLQSKSFLQKIEVLRARYINPVLLITDLKPYQTQSTEPIYPLLFELCKKASETGLEYGFSSQAFALPSTHSHHLHFLILLTEVEHAGIQAPNHLSIPFNLFEPEGLETLHALAQDPILKGIWLKPNNTQLAKGELKRPKIKIWIERPLKAYLPGHDPFFMTAHAYHACAGGQHEKLMPTLQTTLDVETQLSFSSMAQPIQWLSTHLEQFLDLHYFEHTVKTIVRPLVLKVFEYHQALETRAVANQYLGLVESLIKEIDEHLRNHAHVRSIKLAQALGLPSAQALAPTLIQSYQEWIGPLPEHLELGFVLETPLEYSAVHTTTVVAPALDISVLDPSHSPTLDPKHYSLKKETPLQWLTLPALTSTTISS